MGRISRGLSLMDPSYRVLGQDKELMLLATSFRPK